MGPGQYFRAVKQLLLAKEDSYRRGQPFSPDELVSCHCCGVVVRREEVAEKGGWICGQVQPTPTVYDTSAAFQEVFLRSNYDSLPLEPLKREGEKES